MRKKNQKILKLNKKAISNMNRLTVKGGISNLSYCTVYTENIFHSCPIEICRSDYDCNNSFNDVCPDAKKE